jgi:hypothetical protein
MVWTGYDRLIYKQEKVKLPHAPARVILRQLVIFSVTFKSVVVFLNNHITKLPNGMEEKRRSYLKRRKMFRRLALGLFLLLMVLFGLYRYTHLYPDLQTDLNSLPKAGEWPMFRRDLSHTRSTEPGGGIVRGNLKWVFSSGGAIHSSAAIVNGMVYVGSHDRKLYAFE